MKKKFVLTLALVLMVAATLVAAPIELSGYFKTGYTLSLASGANSVTTNGAPQVSLNNLALTGDFWKISFDDMVASGTPISFDGDNQLNKATATIYLDKALAAEGVDLGDMAVTATIGNKTSLGGLSVYSNSRDDLSSLSMKSGEADSSAFGVQLDKGSLFSVYAGADIAAFDTANKAIVLSAKAAPVDGVKAAVAYTNIDAASAKGSVAGSVTVDVAALAGLDFGLVASAYDVFLFTPETNKLYVEVNGSYDKVSAWAEYRIVGKVNDLKVSASYSGIEKVGLSAYVVLGDITKQVAMTTEIGAGANYTMGGVKYALDAAYTTSNKTLALKPTVKISF
ncbi:MAG: hypothetical protein AB7C91_13000 [Sphaerochaeta sp.]|uniref:hypothetical protein n=1 Tax=Sphaerochaeta sp. TaxID=1972642 RepID=UPI003D1241DE